MARAQNVVDVELRGGRVSRGIATGSHAAWLCPCGRSEPLLGRSGFPGGVAEGARVDCPHCRRRYLVVPDGKDPAAVQKIVELD